MVQSVIHLGKDPLINLFYCPPKPYRQFKILSLIKGLERQKGYLHLYHPQEYARQFVIKSNAYIAMSFITSISKALK